MGGNFSNCVPSALTNQSTREFFENLIITATNEIPEKNINKKKVKKMIKYLFDQMRRVPAQSTEFSLVVTRTDVSQVFLSLFIPKLVIPLSLTKVSFRKAGLSKKYASNIALLLFKYQQIEEIDVSENDFGESVHKIVWATSNHKSLRTLLCENSCTFKDSCHDAIYSMLTTTRRMTLIRLYPCKFSPKKTYSLKMAIHLNLSLKSCDFGPDIDFIGDTIKRNNLVYDIVESIVRSPYQKYHRGTIAGAFKSIKGQEMLEGKRRQRANSKGTNLFKKFLEVEARATNTEIQEKTQADEITRSGHAEMIGRRTFMEDVSVILKNIPCENSSFFGVFDGHGGRDAAEYVSENLPIKLKQMYQQNMDLEEIFTKSFIELQEEMKPFCVYFGTTVALAIVDEAYNLYVANVGDTRIVLNRNGTAERLTVDHKASTESEIQFITNHGGCVRDSRINGMLALSRALGDSFLGEVINPLPFYRHIKLEKDDMFFIIACDGVWDVMSDQDAVDLIATEIDPLSAAKKIRDRAYELDSTDNISVVVVFLDNIE